MSLKYLNITEAASQADVTRQTIYRWIEKGVTVDKELLYLTAVIIGGQYHIEEPAFDRFLDDLGYENGESDQD